MEQWKQITGYEGVYSVSNLGNIRRDLASRGTFKRKINPSVDAYGYFYVTLHSNGVAHTYKLHRLVAMMFIGVCPDNLCVSHIDNNKKNNRVYNLEYITPQKNTSIAHKQGLMNYCYGELCHKAKLTEEDVNNLRKEFGGGASRKDLAIKYNISYPNVKNIVANRIWKHLLEVK